MDFNFKQWRNHSEQEEDQQDLLQTSSKLPKLLLNSHPHHHHHPPPPPASSSALPLFVVTEPNTNLSASYSSDHNSTSTKFPRMGSSHFSLTQWQELELQALIFRHMIAGATVPPELLHLVKKSIIVNYPPSYHHYYPHYQPALLQSGYWGKSAMDPEPGRCRRTDGKKWRCSRDVVAGHKYCERHMHRGRNRSRKPVEIPTPATSPYAGGGEALKSNQGVSATSTGGGGFPRFTLSAPPHSSDLLHLNQRPAAKSIIETKVHLEQSQSNNKTLRHFFDDWPPKPLGHDDDNSMMTPSSSSSTKLSISMPENPSSDFSLKLGTGGDGGEAAGGNRVVVDEDSSSRLNWGMMTWQNNPAAPMGGPLAEALRSSVSNSSPTSVLHRLPPGGASQSSYV
ncbi:hypothetical protein ACP275_12G151100 [Erythranthe tilingii]